VAFLSGTASGAKFVRLGDVSSWGDVREKRRVWVWRRPAVSTLVLLLSCSVVPKYVHAQVKPVRRILILNEVGPAFPITQLIDTGIRSGLDISPYKLEFYHEFLDVLLFPDPKDQKQFRDFYIQKYKNRMPDVIVTVGPSPLKFMIEAHETFFTGVPVVFCLPNGLVPGSPSLDSDFTGVETNFAAEETLRVALRLQPGTERVVVVGGVANYDKQRLAIVKQQLKTYEGRLDITYLTDLPMSTLLERLKQLPKHTVVLMTAVGQDVTGTRFNSSETGPMISAAANAPVFSLADLYLGHGEVGGDLADLSQHGKAAAALVLRILNGEKPQDIPRIKNLTTYMFDWRALRRWGFKESDLPAGSVLLFRELSLWDRAKHVWITVAVIILGLFGIAVHLMINRSRLIHARDAQMRLSGLLISAQEMERSRLAAELHDDFSQRLALLAFGLDTSSEGLPESLQTSKQQLQELWNSATEIGADLHTVSHRLHSTTLANLGLVAGVTALCKEFDTRHGLEVSLSSENVPPDVPPNVALCLFRVIQEGLQNLKKHSGAARGEIGLRRVGDRLELHIRDDGRGFDAKAQKNSEGIGILSMGERVRLLGGQFEIRSEPGKGTCIQALLPLQPKETQFPELASLHRSKDTKT
jgi:signal transduction histidine kinase